MITIKINPATYIPTIGSRYGTKFAVMPFPKVNEQITTKEEDVKLLGNGE